MPNGHWDEADRQPDGRVGPPPFAWTVAGTFAIPAVLVVIAIVLLLAADIVGRLVLERPIPAAAEVAELLAHAVLIFALPAACMLAEHVGGLRPLTAPNRPNSVHRTLLAIVQFAILVGIAAAAYRYALAANEAGMTMFVTKLPVAVKPFAVAVAAVLAAGTTLLTIVASFARRGRGLR